MELPLLSFPGNIRNGRRSDMKEELMTEVMQQMLPYLNNIRMSVVMLNGEISAEKKTDS